jgi:hypothetical protein
MFRADANVHSGAVMGAGTGKIVGQALTKSASLHQNTSK